MLRPAMLIALTLGAAGCQGTSSSSNFFAPFGSSRVPAPSTGSVRAGGAYYQPPSTPPQGLSQTSSAPRQGTDLSPSALRPQEKRSQTGATLQLAQSQQKAKGDSVASQRDSVMTRLQGMPVNDATRMAEPRRLKTPSNLVEISQLPPPQATSAWTYGAHPVSQASYTAEDSGGDGQSAWRSKTHRSGSER